MPSTKTALTPRAKARAKLRLSDSNSSIYAPSTTFLPERNGQKTAQRQAAKPTVGSKAICHTAVTQWSQIVTHIIRPEASAFWLISANEPHAYSERSSIIHLWPLKQKDPHETMSMRVQKGRLQVDVRFLDGERLTKVACTEVTRLQLLEVRLLARADLLGNRAARMETATRRRIQR